MRPPVVVHLLCKWQEQGSLIPRLQRQTNFCSVWPGNVAKSRMASLQVEIPQHVVHDTISGCFYSCVLPAARRTVVSGGVSQVWEATDMVCWCVGCGGELGVGGGEECRSRPPTWPSSWIAATQSWVLQLVQSVWWCSTHSNPIAIYQSLLTYHSCEYCGCGVYCGQVNEHD